MRPLANLKLAHIELPLSTLYKEDKFKFSVGSLEKLELIVRSDNECNKVLRFDVANSFPNLKDIYANFHYHNTVF